MRLGIKDAGDKAYREAVHSTTMAQTLYKLRLYEREEKHITETKGGEKHLKALHWEEIQHAAMRTSTH